MIRYLIFKIQLIGHWWRVRWFMLSNLISPPQKRNHIASPCWMDGLENIRLEGHVRIFSDCYIVARPLADSPYCRLQIGAHSMIGHYNHIIAVQDVKIEEHVLTAHRVYISDNIHDYENIALPIMQQPIKQIGSVVIGAGSWLGENVCILGAQIGKHCVVGANSVVTGGVYPDYCVIAGAPARIVKRYNFETGKWEKTSSDGTFIG